MSLVYFALFSLIQFLLVEINCQMASFKPLQRYEHTATFIENKLYILGGEYSNSPSSGKQFFYLDFSGPFNIREPKWKDLSSTNVVPSHSNAAAVKGGGNNSTLFLYGGENLTNSEMALVYAYDLRNNSWIIPKISGDNTVRKMGLTATIESNGKVYLFGGRLASVTYLNDMLILDTINLSWGKGSSVSAPTPRDDCGVALLPDHNIIYIGGHNRDEQFTSNTLNEVHIYNTINDNWNIKNTTGTFPSNRYAFSAILGLDGQRIIIFGGVSTTSTDALHVLNLTNYSWYIPNISGEIPSSRDRHKANVIGKYMVISFGNGYNQSTESDILLLDISNNDQYIWTTQFQPTNNKPPLPSSTSLPTPPPPSSPSPSSSILLSDKSDKSTNNTPVNIGSIIGSLIGGSLLTIGIFLLYIWYKNKQKRRNAIPTPGNVN